jgi:hypothetical protein
MRRAKTATLGAEAKGRSGAGSLLLAYAFDQAGRLVNEGSRILNLWDRDKPQFLMA